MGERIELRIGYHKQEKMHKLAVRLRKESLSVALHSSLEVDERTCLASPLDAIAPPW